MEKQMKVFAIQSVFLGFIGGIASSSLVELARAAPQSLQSLRVRELHVVGKDGSDQIKLTANDQGPTIVLRDKDNRNHITLFIHPSDNEAERRFGLVMGEVVRNPGQVSIMSAGRDFSYFQMSASEARPMVSIIMRPTSDRADVSPVPDASFTVGDSSKGFFAVDTGQRFACTEVTTSHDRIKCINQADQPVRIVHTTRGKFGKDVTESPAIFGEVKPVKPAP